MIKTESVYIPARIHQAPIECEGWLQIAVHLRDRLHALFEIGELRNLTQSIDNFVNLALVTVSEPDNGNIFKILARDGSRNTEEACIVKCLD